MGAVFLQKKRKIYIMYYWTFFDCILLIFFIKDVDYFTRHMMTKIHIRKICKKLFCTSFFVLHFNYFCNYFFIIIIFVPYNYFLTVILSPCFFPLAKSSESYYICSIFFPATHSSLQCAIVKKETHQMLICYYISPKKNHCLNP